MHNFRNSTKNAIFFSLSELPKIFQILHSLSISGGLLLSMKCLYCKILANQYRAMYLQKWPVLVRGLFDQ